ELEEDDLAPAAQIDLEADDRTRAVEPHARGATSALDASTPERDGGFVVEPADVRIAFVDAPRRSMFESDEGHAQLGPWDAELRMEVREVLHVRAVLRELEEVHLHVVRIERAAIREASVVDLGDASEAIRHVLRRRRAGRDVRTDHSVEDLR